MHIHAAGSDGAEGEQRAARPVGPMCLWLKELFHRPTISAELGRKCGDAHNEEVYTSASSLPEFTESADVLLAGGLEESA